MIIEDNTLDSFKARIGAELQGSAIFFKKRIQKDLEDKNINHLNDPSFSFHFEDKHTLNSLFLEFYFTMLPSVGDFATHSFQFKIFVNKKYPYEPPVIHNLNKKLHPNFEIGSQKVFLHILDDFNWKPIYGLYEVLFQLRLILINPNLKYVPNNPENIRLSLKFYGDNTQLIQQMEKLSLEKPEQSETGSTKNSFTSTFFNNLKIDQEPFLESDQESEQAFNQTIPAIDISKHYSKRFYQKLEPPPESKSVHKLHFFK